MFATPESYSRAPAALLYGTAGARLSVAETARLRLRRLSGEDAAFVLELMSDPDFIANIGDRGVHNLEDARRYIVEGPGASYARFGFGLYVVELKADGVRARDVWPLAAGYAPGCGNRLCAAAAGAPPGLCARGGERDDAARGRVTAV